MSFEEESMKRIKKDFAYKEKEFNKYYVEKQKVKEEKSKLFADLIALTSGRTDLDKIIEKLFKRFDKRLGL